MGGLEEPRPHMRRTCALHATALPGPKRQKPEGEIPSWGTTCAPAILAESARTSEVKVGGHPTGDGPPTRGPQLAEKRGTGSNPSIGPTGPPHIDAATPRIKGRGGARVPRGEGRASCLTPFSSARRSLKRKKAMDPRHLGPAYSPLIPAHKGSRKTTISGPRSPHGEPPALPSTHTTGS